MFYFIILLLLLLIGQLLYNNSNQKSKASVSTAQQKKTNRKQEKIYLLLTGFLLFLIMALRAETVGTDTEKYVNIYERIVINNRMPVSQFLQLHRAFQKAPLLFLLLKYYSRLFPQMQAYIFFMAFFTIFFFWIAIYRSGVDCRKAVILYYLLFFTSSLNGNRNYLAFGIFLLGYVLFEHEKRIAGILLVLAATLVHNSAVIGFAIIALSYLNFKNKQVRYIIIAVLAAGILSYQRFLPIFIRLFPIYEDTLEAVDFDTSSRIIVLQVIYLASLLQSIAVLNIKNRIKYVEVVNLERLIILMIGEILLAFTGMQFWYMQRFVHFFQVLVLLQWSAASRYKTRYLAFYKIAVYGMALFYFGYRLYRNQGNPLPYRFFWQ